MLGNAGISDQLSELIWAYTEREAGRDVSLSPENEVMIRELLEKDPAARTLASEFRDVDTGLKAMFRAFGNMPLPDSLVRLMADHGVTKKTEG